MLLLVGLGNPTPNSQNNRHNVGFKIVDAINQKFGLSKQKPKFKGLLTTGSADFQKIWTYMGLPSISLPLLTGENNLPLGVQLVGNKLDDLRFLGTANWLEKNCKDE